MLYDEQGRVKGVATGNMGVGKDGEPTDESQLGMELLGKYTILPKARAATVRQLIAKFNLDADSDPQNLRQWY